MIMSFLFQQFKQRGYTDPSFERRAATTTGQMLNQVVDSPIDVFATAQSASNRRLPNTSNRFSEHDNRNLIQNYGEYFGRGFGKRFPPRNPVYNHDWMFVNEPRPVHPDQSITQRDYRGWPPLENPQFSSSSTANRKKSSGEWMKSCYDDYGRTQERIPSELLYRDDYKKIPIHPWHY